MRGELFICNNVRPEQILAGMEVGEIVAMAVETVAQEQPLAGEASRKLVPMALRQLSEKPSVSVLITCFNYGRFVGEAIDSVLAQTYPATEIIVSDDASTDNSCEVVASYIRRGLPVRLLRNPHGGMAANLNAAYLHCTGEVICLLDADDTFLSNKLEAVVAALGAHPRAGFAVHRASLVDRQQRPRGIYPLLGALPSGDCAVLTYNNAGILMGLPPTTNLSLRREVADRIFPIPVEYTGYAEQIFHRLAPLMTELCAIDEPLARWRLHGANDQNATRLTGRRLERELRIMDSLWLHQKQYLGGIDRVLEEEFPPVSRNPMYLKMNYIRHRLEELPETPRAYDDFCHYGMANRSKINQFWRFSNRLPRPVFHRAVDLLLTQSIWKQMVTRVIRGKQS